MDEGKQFGKIVIKDFFFSGKFSVWLDGREAYDLSGAIGVESVIVKPVSPFIEKLLEPM